MNTQRKLTGKQVKAAIDAMLDEVAEATVEELGFMDAVSTLEVLDDGRFRFHFTRLDVGPGFTDRPGQYTMTLTLSVSQSYEELE